MSKVIAKHSRLPRKSHAAPGSTIVEQTPTTEAPGQTRDLPSEHRALILEQTKSLLLSGHKVKDIAKQLEVSERALKLWILGSDDEELLKAWVDCGLVESDDILENLDEKDINAHLKLAKVRELLRRAQWYAERRNRSRYGDDKFQVNVGVVPVLNIITASDETLEQK